MDKGEEEQEEKLDHGDIIAQYCGFDDAAMGGDDDEEVAASTPGTIVSSPFMLSE